MKYALGYATVNGVKNTPIIIEEGKLPWPLEDVINIEGQPFKYSPAKIEDLRACHCGHALEGKE